MPRGKTDVTETAARNFSDKRSRVMLDGRLSLKGKDMSEQRHRVFLRDQGRCQNCGAWVGEDYGEMHHIIHRGKGGSDDIENLSWSCRKCHRSHHVRVKWGQS